MLKKCLVILGICWILVSVFAVTFAVDYSITDTRLEYQDENRAIVTFTFNNNSISINATIICERNSQKVIIIGKQGSMLKRIGIAARKDIEKLLNKKLNLETFVRVEERWRNSDNYLKEFGYKDE